MKKYIKKHLKDEKRILKLMYKKGILDKEFDLKECGWEYLFRGHKTRRRKGTYGGSDWLPEFHVFWTDYWGEGDSRSVINTFIENIWFENSTIQDDMGCPSENPLSKIDLIKYLQSLPTVNFDSKINKYLRVTPE